MGHGLATRVRGGEVHEMGIMLLVFFPIPYVEASSASAFVKKTDRMLVGAAGMLTELFIAALAFYLWLLLEPGFARSLAYNVIVLASVTTLLFNANPLLRYDGYYILADCGRDSQPGQPRQQVLAVPGRALSVRRHTRPSPRRPHRASGAGSSGTRRWHSSTACSCCSASRCSWPSSTSSSACCWRCGA